MHAHVYLCVCLYVSTCMSILYMCVSVSRICVYLCAHMHVICVSCTHAVSMYSSPRALCRADTALSNPAKPKGAEICAPAETKS